ncbi:MAG: hypothetical protein JW822_04830 [Spirochaetales bacterium]|nr:hypothetical protein [Spirochaetales bacterium]
MKKENVFFIIKMILSLILAVGAPLLIALLLSVDQPTFGILIVVAVINILFLLKSIFSGKLKIFITWFLAVFYILASLFIILYIIVIPYPSYMAWLELVRAGRPGGIISLLFFYGTAFFSSLFAGLVYKNGVLRSLGGLLIVISFEAAVVYQDGLTILLFIAAVILEFILFALLPHKLKLKHAFAPLLLLAAIVAVSAMLSLNSAPNSGYLVGRALDPQLKRIILELFPDLPLLTTVAGYGYDYKAEDLGGRPLLSNAPIFSVRGSSPQGIYLRVQVFNEYTENNWSVSFELRKKIREQPARIMGSRIANRELLEVTLLHDYFEFLPHTIDTESLVVRNQNPVEIAFGTIDTGFNLTLPLLKGDKVQINTVKQETVQNQADQELIDFLEKVMPGSLKVQKGSANTDREEIAVYYLKTSDSISQDIRRLARELSFDAGSDWQILRNIRRFLIKNYIYSLSTSPPAGGEDFLDDFLFNTKKGYCVHFASAFIILARLNGIPARYASGFYAYIPQGESQTVVSGLQAHVWPELWFPNLGWTILEVTPALDLATFYNSEYYRLFNPDNDALTARQLQALMGRKIPPPQEKPIDLHGLLMPALYLLAGAGILAALILIFIWIIKTIRKRKSRYKGTLKKIDRCLQKLVLKLQKQSIHPPQESGWIVWSEKLRHFFPDHENQIDTLIDLVNEIFYNARTPSKSNVQFLKQLSRRL